MSNSLQEKHKALEKELTEQLTDVKDKAIDVGKQALVIAGGVFVAYQIVKMLTSSKKKHKSNSKVYKQIAVEDGDETGVQKIIIQESTPEKSNRFLEEFKAELGALLMGFVKSKIHESLERLNKNMQKSDDEREHS